MIDMELQYLMKKSNEAWEVVSKILDDNEMSLDMGANLMLTLNARFFNGLIKQLDKVSSTAEEDKRHTKEEFVKLLDEKFGSNE